MKMEKRLKEQGKTFFLALLSATALMADAIIPNVEGEMSHLQRFITKARMALPDRGILGLAVFVALWLAYSRYFALRKDKVVPTSKAFAAVALLFAAFMVTGMSVKKFDSLAFVLENKFQMVYSAMLFLGFATMFYMACGLGCYYLKALQLPTPRPGKAMVLLNRHPVAFPVCVLLLCWLPYWISNLPATVVYDMNNQLGQFLGYRTWTNHHPVLGTLIYGSLMSVGRTLHSDNLGFFLCGLYQQILFATSVTYGLCALKRWGASGRFRIVTLLFFALFPIFPFWAQTLLKDSSYFCFILFFCVLFIDFVRALQAEQAAGKILFGMLLWGVAASLVRQNGAYVVIVSLFATIFMFRSWRGRVGAAVGAVAAIVLITAFSSGLMGLFGVEEASSSVALSLSVPFQQTARYVKEYPDEVTQEERAAIDGVLNYEELAERYDPDLSDAVKNTYRGDDTKLSEYMHTWFRMFWKHPIVYIEATLSNTYSYFYPNGDATVEPVIFRGISQKPTPELQGCFVWTNSEARDILYNAANVLKGLPGIGLLMHTGTYTWLLLFLTALALYRRRYDLILGCVPSYMSFLSCMVSPVNGSFRYFLPIVYIMPFLLGWFMLELSPNARSVKNNCKGKSARH